MRKLAPLLLILQSVAAGAPTKPADIDSYCAQVRHEFVEATPRYFSGPDPWVELDSRPDTSSDAALASVYSHGLRVSWVVLEMQGPGDTWFETTHYFFDEAGLILKTERFLEQAQANILIQEATYFHKGKAVKTKYRHTPLAKGKENWDAFYDPHAPEYNSTADLPPLFLPAELKRFAGLKPRPRLRTVCTNAASANPEILLKFSRPVFFFAGCDFFIR